MPSTKLPMRYGHTEGHTDVCFDDSGSCIVTCGSDGDVRIWQSLDDDDPKSINVGEKAYSLTLKNGKMVTAVSNNTVQIHTYPDGAPDGILTRFTSNANHVVFNDDGTEVAAGSSDFLVKVVQVNDSSQQKTFRGHDAPVLSLSFDPKNVFVASASCDGSVRVWNIQDQSCEINWDLLQKCSDVVNAKSICRHAWQPRKGKLLAVPVGTNVKLYERQTWHIQVDLSDDFITQTLNVLTWSPCGQFLVAGSVDGCIVIWNVQTKQCIDRVKHEKGYTICSLAWHPKGGQIAYTDTEGNLGLLDNVCKGGENEPATEVSKAATKDYDDLFDGDDDDEDFLNHDPIEPQDDDDEDGPMLISGRTRIRGPMLDDDDNSLDIPSLKPSIDREKGIDDDVDEASSLRAVPVPAPQRPVYEGPMPTPRQKSFQSGSTPSHLMHRFMVWNSVGVIRCYNDEQDNAIDVEFHDTSVHHAMHLTNTLNHTIADMSQEAVVLACTSTEELQSKLQCLHFSSWDTNKEWTVDLTKNEDIQAVCLGQGWVACATSLQLLRVFTIGGVQREIFSLLGPVVSMSGHGEQLMIMYHRGMGFDGDQCLGVQLMELGKKKCQVLHGDPLPLGRKAHLTWVGFSAEGTPCYVDSEGIVRMLNRGLGNTWAPICDLRDYCKGKSDHYWVVGIHENPQQLRCIPCKGSRFPPTLPRPAVAVLAFKLPYCQIATEKGQMEEQYWRSVVFNHHIDYLSQNDYEFDESVKTQTMKEQQELLMKMFALSCKLEREFRCMELAELMSPNVMNLAIKYASRSKRLILAQRLSDLALERTAELAAAQEKQEDEQVEDFRSRINAGYSRTSTEWSKPSIANHRNEQDIETADEPDTVDELQPESDTDKQKQRLNPFRKSVSSSEEPMTKNEDTAVSGSQGRVNPFKVAAKQNSPGFPGGAVRSANILDNINTFSRKVVTPSTLEPNKQKSVEIKPLIPKPKSKQSQATLFQMVTPKANSKKADEKEKKDENAIPSTPVVTTTKPKTGFQLWLDDNRASILSNNLEMEESEVIKEGMGRFRMLSPEERMLWTEKAKGDSSGDPSNSADAKKRKRPADDKECQKDRQASESEDTATAKKRKPFDQSTNKLSAFAFKKD
ncbi:WD repeat and HMG-box DNA-binding protein 1 [Ambystoma mexicanum]|uniref:WD repeat and HMG-box DNA-binding protein 1 n=1 Tax=Ambystoma mexicanum TaxID=8296 RepID=UPI0037E8DBF2